MPANDSLLFIDSNKYLDLYRIDKGKKLLAPLGEQIEYIFVTQQVVDEVQRNKILVAADFLRNKSKELKLPTFNLPDHLSSTSIEQRNNILQRMSEIHQKIKGMNAEIDALILDLMEQISFSKDEVSKALSLIFANAVPHSSEELERARNRRELGNPPGKTTNPIGDQLSWEQILTQFKDKKRLWIISRDGDYGTPYSGKRFLNRFLYNELCKIAPDPEIYLFEDIAEGINYFVDTTGVKAEQRLTPEEVEEIKREEKALPNLNQSSEAMRNILQKMGRLGQPSDSMLKALKNMEQLSQPNDSMLKVLKNIVEPAVMNYKSPKMLGELQQPLSQVHFPIKNIQEEISEKPQGPPSSIEENENVGENEKEKMQ